MVRACRRTETSQPFSAEASRGRFDSRNCPVLIRLRTFSQSKRACSVKMGLVDCGSLGAALPDQYFDLPQIGIDLVAFVPLAVDGHPSEFSPNTQPILGGERQSVGRLYRTARNTSAQANQRLTRDMDAYSRRVGFRNCCFGACPAVACAPACMVTESPKATLLPECFSPWRHLHEPPRLLPTGATGVGRGSHPLERSTLTRRTGIEASEIPQFFAQSAQNDAIPRHHSGTDRIQTPDDGWLSMTYSPHIEGSPVPDPSQYLGAILLV